MTNLLPSVNSDADDGNQESQLLDDLDFSSFGGTPAEIREAFKKQSNILNTEIIDFLLQWEEEDFSSSGDSLDAQRVKETYEVIESLNVVDRQLEDVEEWLKVQVSSLSHIRGRLNTIEDESGTLENAYHNLKSIKSVSESLIDNLTLSKDEESVIRKNTDVIIKSAFKESSLKSVHKVLEPLLSALQRLQSALEYHGDHEIHNDFLIDEKSSKSSTEKVLGIKQISNKQWQQLQSITLVLTQKDKLKQLLYTFDEKYASLLCSIFSMVLEHKSLQPKSVTTKKSRNKANNTSISIKSFSYAEIINTGLKFNSQALKSIEDASVFSSIRNKDTSLLTTSLYEPMLSLKWSLNKNNENNALLAQKCYHQALTGFIPLYHITLHLFASEFVTQTPNKFPLSLSNAYIKDTSNKLYIPLFKVMFRDLTKLIVSQPINITMANISKFRHSTGLDFIVPIKFVPSNWLVYLQQNESDSDSEDSEDDDDDDDNSSERSHDKDKVVKKDKKSGSRIVNGILNSWTALGVVLLAIAPIIQCEQRFIEVRVILYIIKSCVTFYDYMYIFRQIF